MDSGIDISTDPALVDVDLVHRFLSEVSYWATGRPRDVVERSLAGSMVFGAYAAEGEMVGFARVVTDRATFAWICDVFVVDDHRGRGIGKALVAAVCEHPDLRDIKRMLLATGDAHGLYAPFGFAPLGDAERWMARLGPTP